MAELEPLRGSATLDTTQFRKGIQDVLTDLRSVRDLTRSLGTVTLTVKLGGSQQAQAELQKLMGTASRAFTESGVGQKGLSAVDQQVRSLAGSVKLTRDLFQSQILTDAEAGRSAEALRDKLLRVAAAEGTSGDAVLRAAQAASAAQRTLDATRGQLTKGGLGFSAALGIIEALRGIGGPVGTAAAFIGQAINSGVLAGMKIGKPAVGKGAQDIGQDVIDGLKAKLDIHSPSVVMQKLGQYAADGFALGIKSGIPAATIAGAQLGNAAETGLGAQLRDIFDKTSAGADVAKTAIEAEAEAAANTAEEVNSLADSSAALLEAIAPLGAAALTFGAALATALPLASEFQVAIQAIASESELSADDLKRIGDGLLQVSSDLGVSAVELAKATYDIVGAGVRGAESAEKIVALARQSAQLAGAGMADVATGADLLTSALNAYGLSADNAEHVSDVLFATTTTGKITLAQMGTSMTEVFPLAAKLGVSLESLSGAVAALTSVGVPAEQAVTGIQAALNNVLKPTTEASKTAKDLALGFDAATLKAKGLPAFLKDVSVATQGNSATMSQLFTDVNAVNAVFALTGGVGARKFTEALEKMGQASGTTALGFSEAADTYEHAQDKFRTTIENIQIQFASRYLPTLTTAITKTADFAEGLGKIGDNGLVQFALIVTGATLAANTFIKLGQAAKAAAAGTALFQAVTNAGGLSAYIASLGGISGALRGVTGATVAATVAAAPLAVVALAVGTALASWNLGRLIGEMKLFGDETTSLNDKLTDFFAVNLFGADPQVIKEMRAQEEAQQRAALAAGSNAGAQTDVAAAVRARAEAERQAIAVENAAAAAREQEINTLRAQKAALDDLTTSLGDRQFKVSLVGKSDLQKQLAELGHDFDAMALKVKGAFATAPDSPELKSALSQLRAQQRAEEAALVQAAAVGAEKAARDSALATQRAEIQAMVEGNAKKAALRRLELDQIGQNAKQEADRYRGFPEQQAAILDDGNRVKLAKQAQYAQEDEALARDHAQRVLAAEQSAQDAQVAAMADGVARREAQRALDVERLRASIQAKVDALRGDPEAQAQVSAAGQQELAAKLALQAQQRLQEEKTAQQQVEAARQAARTAELAAITDESARRRAAREDEVAAYTKTLNDRLEATRGYPAKQQAILSSARQEAKGLEGKWAQEDVQDAKDRAQRIADAFLKAQEAQAAAVVAGRDNQRAQFELSLARQLAAVKGHAVQVAEIEQGAIARRAQFTEAAATDQYTREAARLADSLSRALSNEKLSAGEREALYREYYGSLAQLDAAYQTGQKDRLRQREADERAAIEAIRLARLGAAQQPVEASAGRVGDLQRSRDLALSDGEVLRINQQIGAERAGQVAALQGILAGSAGVALTAEERRKLESQIGALQRDQTVSLRDQDVAQRALVESAFSRLDAEAKYAERVARTDQQRQAAGQQQLAVAQARLRELDAEIVAEGRDAQRNALVEKRFGLLGQIADLEDRASAAPLAAEQQRLNLYKLEAQQILVLRGLGDDRVAQAKLTVEIAARELLLANQRVAAAKTQLALEAATSEQAQARLAFAQALQGQVQAGVVASVPVPDPAPLARSSAVIVDIAEAATRAVAGLNDKGQQAIRTAQELLDYQRQQLAGFEAALAQGLNSGTADDILRIRRQHLDNITEAERRLITAQLARIEQEAALGQAYRALNTELGANGERVRGEAVALDGLTRARENLTRAEQEYADARDSYARDPSNDNAIRLNATITALTSSIRGQRDAVSALADEYGKQIGAMDAVREASNRLHAAVYGDTPPDRKAAQDRMDDATTQLDQARDDLARLKVTQRKERDRAQKTLDSALAGQNQDAIQRAREELATLRDSQLDAVQRLEKQLTASEKSRRDQVTALEKAVADFNPTVELDRLEAIQARRDAAQEALALALKGGETGLIEKAASDLAVQEQRYKVQADLLERNGQTVARQGQAVTRQLADQVDALGISFDRAIADRITALNSAELEALTVRTRLAQQETAAAEEFRGALRESTELFRRLRTLPTPGAPQVAPYTTRNAPATPAAGPNGTPSNPVRVDLSTVNLDALAGKIAGGVAAAVPKAPATYDVKLGELLQSLRDAQTRTLGRDTVARPAAALVATPATVPVVNNTVSYIFGDIHVSAPPNLNPRQIAQGVRREFEDDLRRNPVRCK